MPGLGLRTWTTGSFLRMQLRPGSSLVGSERPAGGGYGLDEGILPIQHAVAVAHIITQSATGKPRLSRSECTWANGLTLSPAFFQKWVCMRNRPPTSVKSLNQVVISISFSTYHVRSKGPRVHGEVAYKKLRLELEVPPPLLSYHPLASRAGTVAPAPILR